MMLKNRLKTLFFLAGVILLASVSQAQDYKINFTASGIATTLDSVHVLNLTQQTALTLDGSDTLHLYKEDTTGAGEVYKGSSEVSFYPNPLMNGEGKLRLYHHKSGEARIAVYDTQGKLLLSKKRYLESGHSEFLLSGMPAGVFIVSVHNQSFSRSTKIVSINGSGGAPNIAFRKGLKLTNQWAEKSSITPVRGITGMPYNDGEPLKITGYADSLASIYSITPTQSQTVDFYFGSAPWYPPGTVHCISGVADVMDVTNPTTGETWMDRNLGASRQATSSTDSLAYGDLYQWGRFSDGHQCRNSNTTSSLSSSDTPGHGDFITSSSASNWDWRSPQNDSLWQGVNGTNNPCPNGYRLPTVNELINERQSWSSNDAAGAYGSPLKLPVAGIRIFSSGSLDGVGSYGSYWSSTVVSSRAYYLLFFSTAPVSGSNRAHGYPVRCLKD